MLTFAVSLFLVLAAEGQPQAQTEATSGQAKSEKTRLVCRKDRRANSRVAIKVCKTREEWDSQMEAARQSVGEIQQRQQVPLCAPAGC
ncbi:MAG: hypothetical protein Q7J28_14905 [Caulobacter sp.]|nr:hypothetical protein [Caulobacter sp.]